MNDLTELHQELCRLRDELWEPKQSSPEYVLGRREGIGYAAELVAELMASVKDARDAARRVALQQRKLPSLAKRIHVQAAVYDRIIGEEEPNV